MFLKHAIVALVIGANLFSSSEAVALDPDIDDLEVRVWNCEDHELLDIENTIARNIQEVPGNAFSYYLMSRVYLRRFSQSPGDLSLLKQASELAEQAVELDPKSDAGFIALADILDIMGHANKGLTLLGQAEKISQTESWRIPFTKARLQVDTLNSTDSLALLAKAFKAKDVKVSVVVPYVIALLQTNYQGQELIDKLSLWHARHPHGLFLQTLASSYSDIGNYKQSHAYYTLVQKDYPNIKEAKINDAIILYKHMKQPKQAIKMLEEAVNTQSTAFEKQHLTTIYLHLAAAYLEQNEIQKAKDMNFKAVSNSPTASSTLEFITKSYRDKKLHKPFVEFVDYVTNELVGNGTLFALMGETLSDSLKNHKDALVAYQKAIVLEPHRSDLYNGYGLAFYRMTNYKDALAQFAVAVQVDPEDATAKYNQACTLSLLGRKNEALAALSDAITLDPRLQESARKDADFAQIQNLRKFKEIVFDEPVFVNDDEKSSTKTQKLSH